MSGDGYFASQCKIALNYVLWKGSDQLEFFTSAEIHTTEGICVLSLEEFRGTCIISIKINAIKTYVNSKFIMAAYN